VKKTVAFKNPVRPVDPADTWVADRKADVETPPSTPEVPAEVMKRFTIDVPESLHTRVKVACAQRGLKMADVLREMMEREFPS
jgi:ParG